MIEGPPGSGSIPPEAEPGADAERDLKEQRAAYLETGLNGRAINWQYWGAYMPFLSAREAACLMAGLDPDLYTELSARSADDQRHVCQKVVYLERLARAQGRDTGTAMDWFLWAKQHGFAVHIGFELAVTGNGAPAAPPASESRQRRTTAAAPDKDWKKLAQERARNIIARQKQKDLYPSQQDIAEEIARDFRGEGIVGTDGKPVTGATIKRHALKGISSAEDKQFSTARSRGK